MKKANIISRLLLVLLAASLLCSAILLPASATENQFEGKLSIGEDYQTATYNGKMYLAIDGYYVNLHNHSYIYDDDIILTEQQKSIIEYVSAFASDIFMSITISYTDGGEYEYIYIDSAYYDHYTEFVNTAGSQYIIYHSDYTTKTTFDDITTTMCVEGNQSVIKSYELNYMYLVANLYTADELMYFEKTCGSIYKKADGTYYYIDEYQYGVPPQHNFDHMAHDEITIYKITNAEIIDVLNNAFFYTSDYPNGYPDYEEHTPSTASLIISGIVLTLLLAVAPLVTIIICLVMSAKVPKPYKTCLRMAATMLGGSITVLTVIIILMFIV